MRSVSATSRCNGRSEIRRSFFVTKPGRLIYLLAYVSDQREVWLDLPLEAVESVLKLLCQMFARSSLPTAPATEVIKSVIEPYDFLGPSWPHAPG